MHENIQGDQERRIGGSEILDIFLDNQLFY